MNNRLDIPIQPPVRVKTENIEADATPVPASRKERNRLMKEIVKNESESGNKPVSAETK